MEALNDRFNKENTSKLSLLNIHDALTDVLSRRVAYITLLIKEAEALTTQVDGLDKHLDELFGVDVNQVDYELYAGSD